MRHACGKRLTRQAMTPKMATQVTPAPVFPTPLTTPASIPTPFLYTTAAAEKDHNCHKVIPSHHSDTNQIHVQIWSL